MIWWGTQTQSLFALKSFLFSGWIEAKARERKKKKEKKKATDHAHHNQTLIINQFLLEREDTVAATFRRSLCVYIRVCTYCMCVCVSVCMCLCVCVCPHACVRIILSTLVNLKDSCLKSRVLRETSSVEGLFRVLMRKNI